MQASAHGLGFFRFLFFAGKKWSVLYELGGWPIWFYHVLAKYYPRLSVQSIILKCFGFKCPAMKWALRSVRLSWWSSVLGMGSSVPAVGLSCRSHIHIPNSMWDQRKSSSSWAFSFGWMVHEILSWIPHCNEYRKVALGQLMRLPLTQCGQPLM